MGVSLEVLGFVRDDTSGSYCQAIHLVASEKEIFILHRVRIREDQVAHEKREFSSKRELIANFPSHYSPASQWTRTDLGLGYRISEQDISEARKNYILSKSQR